MNLRDGNSMSKTFILAISILITTGCWWAEAADSNGNQVQPDSSAATSLFDGAIIDSILIENRNIYATDSKEYDNFIFRTANRLHIRSRQSVIRRELVFKEGDRYSSKLAAETERNLRRRLILFDAFVKPERLPDNRLLVRVVTIDQWSLSGGFQYNREGNQTRYQLGATEKNLLGNNQFLSAFYFWDELEGNYFQSRFADNRFYGRPIRVDAAYNDDPLSGNRQFNLGHPYYNLSQDWTFNMSVATIKGRRDVYRDSTRIGQSRYIGDIASAQIGWRTGSYYRKVGLSLTYGYRLRTAFDKDIFGVTPDDSQKVISSFPIDSLYHRLGLSLQIADNKYITLRQIDGFSYTEDITLGQMGDLGFSRAYHPDSLIFSTVSFQVANALWLEPNLLLLVYTGSIQYKGSTTFRRQSMVSIKYYNQPADFMTIAGRVFYQSDWWLGGSDNLNLGGSNGLRGFDKFFKSGNRMAVVNLEGRFYPNIEFLSVILGGAVFVDAGRTWKSDDVLNLQAFQAAVGAGLRISFEKSSKESLVRIDLAYSEYKGWQLSIGTGQYFTASLPRLGLTGF